MRSLSDRNGAFSTFSLMNLVSTCFLARMARCLSRILHLHEKKNRKKQPFYIKLLATYQNQSIDIVHCYSPEGWIFVEVADNLLTLLHFIEKVFLTGDFFVFPMALGQPLLKNKEPKLHNWMTENQKYFRQVG